MRVRVVIGIPPSSDAKNQELATKCRTQNLHTPLSITTAGVDSASRWMVARLAPWIISHKLEETISELHALHMCNGFTYMLTDQAKTWSESRMMCQKQGGDLAAAGIRDPTARRSIGEALLQESSQAWIGLNDKKIEGQFIWVDGILSTKENTPWSNGEPNGLGEEDCVEIEKGNLNVNDELCSQGRRGICEISWLS